MRINEYCDKCRGRGTIPPTRMICDVCKGDGHVRHTCPDPYTPPLKWTRERPAVDGWYWVRSSMGRVEMAKVQDGIAFGMNSADLVVMARNVDKFDDVTWAGPIAPPREG